MKPLKERVSLTLDSDIVERVREAAEYEDRSFSSFVNLVLRRYFTSKDKKDTKQK